jgi:mono/diheme cytochrome c family protein
MQLRSAGWIGFFRLATGGHWLAALTLLLGLVAPASAGDAYRRQIEDDWRRQDECRVNEIRRAGVVRFPAGPIQWPGVQAEENLGGLKVPATPAAKIDGRLDDPCWKQAVVAPAGPGDHPVVPALRLCRDERSVYVAATFPTAAEANFYPASAALDAGGAVDGVKNGRYAFHTAMEPDPWWQVDLGVRQPIARVVVYNRLDYEPGVDNADNLVILTSDDGRSWLQRYENQGKHFGGVGRGRPLDAPFREKVEARFVRLQIRSRTPLFFHLDEVEVYGPTDPAKNIALGRPALQSSTSTWSKGGPLFTLGATKVFLEGSGDAAGLAADGRRLSAEQAAIRRDGGQTTVEVALPVADQRGRFYSAFTPYHGQPVALAGGRAGGQVVWPDALRLGFGRNRLALGLQGDRPFDPPAELTVETVVFTQKGAEQRTVWQKKVSAEGPVPVEFQIAHEGAAAVIATLRHGSVSLRDGRTFFVAPVRESLDRAAQIAADAGLPLPEQLDALRKKADDLDAREKVAGTDPDARSALYREARWLARKTAFDGRLDFGKLVVLKRFTQETYPDVCLNHMPWCSRPGGDIAVLTLAGPETECQVRPVIGGQLGPGHLHGMDLWYDADRLVFGYARSKTDKPPPGWLDRRTSFELRRTVEPTHLFEIKTDGSGLRQLTSGEWSDIDPTYLPSGEVAFASERCGASLQCNEYDKDETSCNLYVMRGDGRNIRRLTVTKDGDYLPHALDDGTIAYTRWEYQERGWANIQSIWIIRPDGTGADALFKQHFNDPWALEDVRSIPASKRLVAVATGHHTLAAGPIVRIDVRHGMNNPAGIGIVTPGVIPPEGGMSGRCVPEGGVRGVGGYYMTPWALSEKTFLASYSYCSGRVTGAGTEIDPTGYAIYLADVFGTKELVYRDPAISCFVPIPLRPRPKPPVLPDATDPKVKYAVCSAADVSRGVPGIPREKIRYLRISEGLYWPYSNQFGGERYEPDVKSVMINWNPARVFGEVPIEPDGSAHFLVPVDTAVYFQLLDENHMELRRMRSFISFQPGEMRGCTGCHESREQTSHHAIAPFPAALAREPSVPVPPPWGTRAISFLRDVQPVFDKHCAGCHAGLKPAAGLDFSGGLTERHNRAYDTILANRLIARSNVGDDARITQPLAFGSHRSRLVEVLRDGACSKRAKLSSEDWLRLVTWIDANGPYHGGFINKRQEPTPYDLPNDNALAGRLVAVHQKRCIACHQPADVTRLDWIDLGEPEKSRFLAAPLAKDSGGTGRCGQAVYKDRRDADYQAALAAVNVAVKAARARPRRDLAEIGP